MEYPSDTQDIFFKLNNYNILYQSGMLAKFSPFYSSRTDKDFSMTHKTIFFLSVFCALLNTTATGREPFRCQKALESLKDIQRQQLLLTPDQSPSNLLKLENQFERNKARLTLLKGLQKLNEQYHHLKKMIKDTAATPPHAKDELIGMTNQLLSHQPTIQRIHTANQILKVLSRHDAEGTLKKLISGPKPIQAQQMITFLQTNCTSECDQLEPLLKQDNSFGQGMASLVTSLMNDLEPCKTEDHRCKTKRVREFQQEMNTHRDVLLDKIPLTDWEQGTFAQDQRAALEDKRNRLVSCQQEDCNEQSAELTEAILAYREEVFRLEKGEDGVVRAWSALKEFHDNAKHIRVDEEFETAINQRFVEEFVRANDEEKENLKSQLTPQELAVATIKSTQKNLMDQLMFDSYSQSREKLRQDFAERADSQMNDFFSNSNSGKENRLEHFNSILNNLLDSVDEFLIEKDGKIALEDSKFFEHLDFLHSSEGEGQEKIKERLDGEIAKIQNRLEYLSKSINFIEQKPFYRQGDRLKRYIFDRFQKNCPQHQDSSQIQCKAVIGPEGQREVHILGQDILAVIDDPTGPEPILSLDKICRGSSLYRSACTFVSDEYENRYPSGTAQNVIERTNRETVIYNRKGRAVEIINHDTSFGEHLVMGFGHALNNPQNMETLFMLMTQKQWDEQLDSYVEWGQQEKSWYHQSEQYREYAQERWVEEWFQKLNPVFSPSS